MSAKALSVSFCVTHTMAVASTLLQNDKLRKITLERVENFLSHESWTDVNLWSKLYSKTSQSAVKVINAFL